MTVLTYLGFPSPSLSCCFPPACLCVCVSFIPSFFFPLLVSLSPVSVRTRREIKIVDKDLPDSEIDKIIESGKAQEVIRNALVSDNLKSVVAVIEERHLDILKLEHQVLEIYELFRDLATLVDLQQESLDVIENRIMKAKNYTEKAEVELNEAEEYQKKARAVSRQRQTDGQTHTHTHTYRDS